MDAAQLIEIAEAIGTSGKMEFVRPHLDALRDLGYAVITDHYEWYKGNNVDGGEMYTVQNAAIDGIWPADGEDTCVVEIGTRCGVIQGCSLAFGKAQSGLEWCWDKVVMGNFLVLTGDILLCESNGGKHPPYWYTQIRNDSHPWYVFTVNDTISLVDLEDSPVET